MMSSNTYGKTQSFKKKNPNANVESASRPTDKLGDLKSKLQKEKEIMKKTGKRFRHDSMATTQEISISTDLIRQQNISTNGNTNHDVSTGPELAAKQTISLKDISLPDQSSRQQSVRSSQLFAVQVKQQKKRSQQVYNFLKKLGLGSFASPLIQNGFDDLQTLAHVTTDDLNLLMMRAYQQIILIDAIESFKQVSISDIGPKPKQEFNSSSTLWRAKTEPMESLLSSRTEQVKSSQILARMKVEQGKEPESGLKPGSFLFSVGSRNWSVEDQVRRACSVCYRVEQQMEKKGDCYYCCNCYKYVSEDLLQISIGKSMTREYSKSQQF